MTQLKVIVGIVFAALAVAAEQIGTISGWVPLLNVQAPVSAARFLEYVRDSDQLKALLESKDYKVLEMSPWVDDMDTRKSTNGIDEYASKMAQRDAKFTSFTAAWYGSFTTHVTKTQEVACEDPSKVVFLDTVDATFTGSRFLSEMHTVCLWVVTQAPSDADKCSISLSARVKLPKLINIAGQMEKQVLQTTKEYGQSMIDRLLAWKQGQSDGSGSSGNVFSFIPNVGAKLKGFSGSS